MRFRPRCEVCSLELSWIWLEVTLAALGGIAGGWFAHSILRSRRVLRISTSTGTVSEGIATSPPTEAPPVARVLTRAPLTVPRRLSPEADTAGRVISHLASLGRLGNDEVGLIGYTQQGMSEALGLRQGTLTKVLSRLRAANVVEVDRRHVRGQPRRLNVYRLTALGESIARDIRPRQSPPAAAGSRIEDPSKLTIPP